MKYIIKIPAIISILVVLTIAVLACAPAAVPTPTPAKAPTGASPTAAPAKTQASQTEATKPAASTPTVPSKTLAPYKIGVALALSGEFTTIGIPSRDAMVALANEINTAGGINSRKIELVIYDDATDETKAILALKKLINDDKVLAIIGPTGSGLAMAAVPVVEDGQVPMIAVAGGATIVSPVKKWVFKLVAGEDKVIPEVYGYFKSKGIKKLATFNPATQTGKGATAVIQPTAAKEGFELVAQETFDPNDKDFSAQLTRIKASGSQGLIIYDATVATALIAKQMKTMGLNIPWTGTYGMLSPANIQAAGEAFDGVIVATPKVYVVQQLPDSDPQKKVALQFMDAYKKTTGKDADPLGGSGWDPLLAISEALKKTNPDPDKLAEAREKFGTG